MTAVNADLQHLLNQARMKLVGVSDAGLKDEIYEVYREFFKDSTVWRNSFVLHLKAAKQTYDMIPADDCIPNGIMIQLLGVWTVANLLPLAAVMQVPDQLILRDPPNVAQDVTVAVIRSIAAQKAGERIPAVPDWVLPLWGGVILDGLLGRMMLQPNRGYSNSQLATYHLKRFRTGIAEARVSAARMNTNGVQSWRFPQNFRTRNQHYGVSTAIPQRF